MLATASSSTTISGSITPDAPNSLVVSVLAANDSLGQPTPQQGQTQVYNPTGFSSNEFVIVAFSQSSTATPISYSLGTLSSAAMVAITLRPASTGSIWQPNVNLRQIGSVVEDNGLNNAVTLPGAYGYQPTQFFQNSFLNTVGRRTVKVNTVASVNITQVAANVTATGGTQTVATTQLGTVTQVAATVTASGGTQTLASSNLVSLAQVAATVTASGGTQVLASSQLVSIAQLVANVTASGGTQSVSTFAVSNFTPLSFSLSSTSVANNLNQSPTSSTISGESSNKNINDSDLDTSLNTT
jgi:hypothetical protein